MLFKSRFTPRTADTLDSSDPYAPKSYETKLRTESPKGFTSTRSDEDRPFRPQQGNDSQEPDHIFKDKGLKDDSGRQVPGETDRDHGNDSLRAPFRHQDPAKTLRGMLAVHLTPKGTALLAAKQRHAQFPGQEKSREEMEGLDSELNLSETAKDVLQEIMEIGSGSPVEYDFQSLSDEDKSALFELKSSGLVDFPKKVQWVRREVPREERGWWGASAKKVPVVRVSPKQSGQELAWSQLRDPEPVSITEYPPETRMQLQEEELQSRERPFWERREESEQADVDNFLMAVSQPGPVSMEEIQALQDLLGVPRAASFNPRFGQGGEVDIETLLEEQRGLPTEHIEKTKERTTRGEPGMPGWTKEQLAGPKEYKEKERAIAEIDADPFRFMVELLKRERGGSSFYVAPSIVDTPAADALNEHLAPLVESRRIEITGDPQAGYQIRLTGAGLQYLTSASQLAGPMALEQRIPVGEFQVSQETAPQEEQELPEMSAEQSQQWFREREGEQGWKDPAEWVQTLRGEGASNAEIANFMVIDMGFDPEETNQALQQQIETAPMQRQQLRAFYTIKDVEMFAPDVAKEMFRRGVWNIDKQIFDEEWNEVAKKREGFRRTAADAHNYKMSDEWRRDAPHGPVVEYYDNWDVEWVLLKARKGDLPGKRVRAFKSAEEARKGAVMSGDGNYVIEGRALRDDSYWGYYVVTVRDGKTTRYAKKFVKPRESGITHVASSLGTTPISYEGFLAEAALFGRRVRARLSNQAAAALRSLYKSSLRALEKVSVSMKSFPEKEDRMAIRSVFASLDEHLDQLESIAGVVTPELEEERHEIEEGTEEATGMDIDQGGEVGEPAEHAQQVEEPTGPEGFDLDAASLGGW